MTKSCEILVLSSDQQRRNDWCAALQRHANVSTSFGMLLENGADVPDLIVTDTLPITEPLGHVTQMVASGEILVVAVGTELAADVVLPNDCSVRELCLACRLASEIADLRRRLANEKDTQRSLRRMAYRDPLTGLANRRKWDHEFAARIERLRNGGPNDVLGVVLLDLDNFKPLNDQLGHIVGDTILRRVGHRLAANVTAQHIAARIGGDEFGVLLSGILAQDIPDVADRIRRSLQYVVEEAGGDVPALTTSAGVAIVRSTDSVSPLKVLETADRALRRAKQQGRDRTITEPLDPDTQNAPVPDAP